MFCQYYVTLLCTLDDRGKEGPPPIDVDGGVLSLLLPSKE